MGNIEFTTENIDFGLLFYDFLETEKYLKEFNKNNIKTINENEFVYTLNKDNNYKIKVETDLLTGESFLYNAEDYLEQNELDCLIFVIEAKKEIYIFKKEKLLGWLRKNNEAIGNKLNSINKEIVYERKYSVKNEEEVNEIKCKEIKNLSLFNLSITPQKITYRKRLSNIPFVIEEPNNFTIKELEKQFKNIKFNVFYDKFRKLEKNKDLENAKLPPIVYVYYFLLLENRNPPTPEEVVNFYFKSFCKKTDDNQYTSKYKSDTEVYFSYEDLAGRICRAYNSFNREIHTFLRLKEAGLAVEYSFEKDFLKGVDLVVNHNEMYEIRIAQNSRRSNDFIEKKENGRHVYRKENVIALLMDDSNSHNIGDVKVFNERVIKNVIKEIKGEPVEENEPEKTSDFKRITEEGIQECLEIFKD